MPSKKAALPLLAITTLLALCGQLSARGLGGRPSLVNQLQGRASSLLGFLKETAQSTSTMAALASKQGKHDNAMHAFLAALPKAELHLHLEGTLEVEMMFEFAERNGLPPPYPSIEDAREAYEFKDLQSFLDLYYKGCQVLLTPDDFYDLAMAYFKKAHAQGVMHVELFFDPQTHLARNISFATFFKAIKHAAEDAKTEMGLDVHLIMCFLRHLDEKSAFEALMLAVPYLLHILGVGLDSSESGRPPSLFKNVFKTARSFGLHVVAHAGEEGPAEYVWEAIKDLDAERIDHGIHSIDDPKLVAYLEVHQMGITLCPLSNLRLKVFDSNHTARQMLSALIEGTSMVTTLNSDDPAYFGGYVLENYIWVQELLELSVHQMAQLAKNSFQASFVGSSQKEEYFITIDQLTNNFVKNDNLVAN